MAYLADQTIARFNQIDMVSVQNQAAQVTIDVGSSTYVIKRVVVANVTGTITSAVGGLYTAPNKGGTIIVAATQSYNALPSTKTADLTITAAATNLVLNGGFLYLTLSTGSSTPSRADIYIIADVITP